MNRKCQITLLIVTLTAIVLSCITPALAGGFGSYGGDGNDLDLSPLEIGDIILTKEAIAYSENIIPGAWDHAAIYIGNNLQVEAWGGGVRIMPVEIALTASGAAIYRVDASDSVKQRAVDFCLTQLGKQFDIFLAFWPGSKNKNSNLWYCSELVWAAYIHQGIDLDHRPGYSWTYWFNVAPTELAKDSDTYLIDIAE